MGVVSFVAFKKFSPPSSMVDQSSESPARPVAALMKKINNADGSIRSIEDFIAALPADYLSRHTFVYGTRSLQGASFEFPRVIVFGEDAKEMIAFNGNSQQAGFQQIEVMRFNDQSQSFQLHEIDFKESSAHVSEANPAKCLRCHGLSPRPNWNAYFFWPGLYGSEDDSLFSTNNYAKHDFSAVEVKAYEKFSSGARKAGRYKLLPEMKPVMSGYSIRPNADLSGLLLVLNAGRISQKIQESPVFKNFRLGFGALLQAALNSIQTGSPQPLPDSMAFLKPGMTANLEMIRQSKINSLLTNESFHFSKVGPFMSERLTTGDGGARLRNAHQNRSIYEDALGQPDDGPGIAAFLEFSKILDIGKTDLSMVFPNRELDFNDSNFGFEKYLKLIVSRLFKTEEIAQFSSAAANEQLRQIALALEKKNSDLAEKDQTNLSAAVFSSCLLCHQGNEAETPKISFHDSSIFMQELRNQPELKAAILRRIEAPISSDEHMPPFQFLSQGEKDRIKKFLSF